MGFKPKENTGQRISQQQEMVFSREQLVSDVFNDEYVLVVGSEVIMNKQEEPTGDVNQYILRALNASLDSSQMIIRSSYGMWKTGSWFILWKVI